MSSRHRFHIIFPYVLLLLLIVVFISLVFNFAAGHPVSILPIKGQVGLVSSFFILLVLIFLSFLELKKVVAIKINGQHLIWATIYHSQQLDFNQIISMNEERVTSRISNKSRITVIKTKNDRFVISEFYIANYEAIVSQIQKKADLK